MLRLARDPEVEAMALRGGMRIRQAFGGRAASDVDLVHLGAVMPELRPWFRRIASTALADGVRIDAERVRIDDVVVRGRRLGARIVAAGRVDGVSADFTVDVHQRLALGVEPVRRPLQAERGTGHVWMCESETLIGRKVRVTAELGRDRFRPKDIADLADLASVPCSSRDRLAAGLHAAFEGAPDARDAARAAFGSRSWWSDRRTRLRWRRWDRRDLLAVVEPVIATIADILEGPP